MSDDNWPKHANGENKTIGEMTEDERRPILRAAFLRSKLAAAWPDAFEEHSEMSDWIEWAGGPRPVSPDTMVEVRLRDGELKAEIGEAVEFGWLHEIMDDDIIAYRIIKESEA